MYDYYVEQLNYSSIFRLSIKTMIFLPKITALVDICDIYHSDDKSSCYLGAYDHVGIIFEEN